MPSSNLPYTPFTQSGASVIGVTPVSRDERTLLGEYQNDAVYVASAERQTRRRTMEPAEAEAEIAAWVAGGATVVAVPDGWRAWQRERGDAITGGKRLQRLAVSDHAPHEVINWSAPLPLIGADGEHWHGLLDPRGPSDDRGPLPFMGWTA